MTFRPQKGTHFKKGNRLKKPAFFREKGIFWGKIEVKPSLPGCQWPPVTGRGRHLEPFDDPAVLVGVKRPCFEGYTLQT